MLIFFGKDGKLQNKLDFSILRERLFSQSQALIPELTQV